MPLDRTILSAWESATCYVQALSFVAAQTEIGVIILSTSPKKRAPQNRAAVTKEKLQAATLSVILREGWSGTSTLKVCREAEVSNGAQTHHYPKKSDLLIAALKRNRDELKARTEKGLDKGQDESLAIRDYIELLRPKMRDEPYYYATVESLIAARSDETLRHELKDIDSDWIETLRSLTVGRIEKLPRGLHAEDIAELTLYLIRGMVIQRGAHLNADHLDKMFGLWCDLIERAVVPATRPRNATGTRAHHQ